MGQKVNPTVFRLGINKEWQSVWYSSSGEYGNILHQDNLLRKIITKYTDKFGVSKIEIERPGGAIKASIFAARPGLLVGRKGEELDNIKRKISSKIKGELHLTVQEVRRPETDAMLIARNIAIQLEKRLAFRRVIKKAMQNAMRFNIGGCKIMVSGRLNGADIARSEWIREGRVPLHTIKANIDYATREAMTVFGLIGVKVWVYNEIEDYSKSRKNIKQSK